jgi:uncharacterized membrane protein
MTDVDARGKRPVSAALAGPYGHPLHPMMVALPIGAWVCSLVLDVASLFVSDASALSAAAQWLIAIGVLGALGAASVGFLDYFGIPAGTPAQRTALLHMCINLGVTVAFAADFVWRSGSAGNGATPVGPLVLSVIALGGLTVSGYLGGKLAYRYGVRVAAESVQAEGFTARPQRHAVQENRSHAER